MSHWTLFNLYTDLIILESWSHSFYNRLYYSDALLYQFSWVCFISMRACERTDSRPHKQAHTVVIHLWLYSFVQLRVCNVILSQKTHIQQYTGMTVSTPFACEILDGSNLDSQVANWLHLDWGNMHQIRLLHVASGHHERKSAWNINTELRCFDVHATYCEFIH